jgi:hypothetical protein
VRLSLSTHEHLYKQLTLCELFISSQYVIRILQTLPLKLLTSSSEPRHVVLEHGMTWRIGGFDTIYNDQEKNASQICAITPK